MPSSPSQHQHEITRSTISDDNDNDYDEDDDYDKEEDDNPPSSTELTKQGEAWSLTSSHQSSHSGH